jgi:hypothetical protein
MRARGQQIRLDGDHFVTAFEASCAASCRYCPEKILMDEEKTHRCTVVEHARAKWL